MHEFGWLPETFLNFLPCFRKKGIPRKGVGAFLQKSGGSNHGGNNDYGFSFRDDNFYETSIFISTFQLFLKIFCLVCDVN